MSKNTPQRLLDAALDVFAEQGYQSATIQQIVQRAGTNIAAINYHFRNKANFYVEVVLYGCDKNGLVQPDFLLNNEPAEEQLFQFIHWFLKRGLQLNSDSLLDQIHMQELANPSPVLDKIVERLIRPVHNILRQIITQLLPEDATEQALKFHCFSVIGQCNLYKVGKPVMTRLYPEFELDEAALEDLTQHIYSVSLAGILASHTSS